MNTLPVTLIVTTNVTIRNDLGLQELLRANARGEEYVPNPHEVRAARHEVRRALKCSHNTL